jgi:hypothetical protein
VSRRLAALRITSEMVMWYPRRTVATTVTAAVIAVAASTELTARTGPGEETGSRVQFGVGTGVVLILPTIGARLTVPFEPRLAVEYVGELMPLTFEEQSATWLLFQAQLRHQFRRGRSWTVHATYGMSFIGKYTHRPESRVSRPDGSVLVYPAYRRFRIESPPGAHAGIGGERPISRRAVLRWDVQVLVPVAEHVFPVPRATVGVSWQRGAR